MALYGHEISEEIDPLSAGLNFAGKLDKGDDDEQVGHFIGQDALKEIARQGPGQRWDLHRVTAQGPRGLLKDLRLHADDWGFEICEVRNVPVTIWSGGDDPIAPPSISRYFNRQISGSRLTTGPRDGHVTLLKNHADLILGQFRQ